MLGQKALNELEGSCRQYGVSCQAPPTLLQAHEDSEKLREIVLPMEQEIEELKAKLLRAEELIQEIQRRPQHPPSLHDSVELLPLSRDPSPTLEPLEELSGDGGAAAEAFAHNCDDSASISSFSLGGGAGGSASLPRSRQGLSSEQEETASLVSTGTLVPEGIYLPPPGYQLVPDTQWEQLQVEVSGVACLPVHTYLSLHQIYLPSTYCV